MKKIFLFSFLILALSAVEVFNLTSVRAQTNRYPIRELGSCRNQQACFTYAKTHGLIQEDIEVHHLMIKTLAPPPAEILEKARTELGCASYESCAKFCGDPKNVEKCMTLGRRHGMGPPPKPCTNEAECRAYCEKHPNDCPGFPKNE